MSQLKELQAVALEILLEFDKLCRNKDIPYFLDCGTVLGAVRHGGFIPWDDDIDVGMLRKDYERFLAIAQHELPEFLVLQNYQTEKAPFVFSKIRKKNTTYLQFNLRNLPISRGIFIDILPYDFLPEDTNEAWLHIKKCNRIQRLFYLRMIPDRVIPPNGKISWYLKAMVRRIVHYVLHIFSSEKIVTKMEEAFKAHPESSKITCHFHGENFIDIYDYSEIFPLKEIVFEGHSFPAPRLTHEFLTKLYGDYMQPPPIDQRVWHLPIKISTDREI
ncbi:MAG: LicD family protein [Saccharofermentanales bacterium]|jgi:lipopolysaccharide cholinephosphotransferase